MKAQGLCQVPGSDFAICLAILRQKDERLAVVVEAWDSLPEAIKNDIAAKADPTGK
jgi:hypothetical protein